MKLNHSFKTLFLMGFIVSLCATAIVGIWIFLFGTFGDLEGRLLFTTITIGAYSLTALCNSALFGRQRVELVGYLGIAISIAGFLYTTLVIWDFFDIGYSWKGIFIFAFLAFSLAHTSLLMLVYLRNYLVMSVLSATICSILIVAGMLIFLVVYEKDIPEVYFRVLGVFAILDVFGTIMTPILSKIRKVEIGRQY